jgi:hypothetical protein
MSRRTLAAVVVLAAAPGFGCSFIFSEGPPPNHARLPYFDCSSSYAPPVLDTIWGGLNLLGATLALAQSEEEWNREQTTDRNVAIVTGLLWTALSGSSAAYGYNKVGACKQAKEQLMLRQMRPGPGWTPQGWPPPPGSPPPGGPPPGYPPPGYPPPGYPPPGYPPPGYPPPGYPPPGAPGPTTPGPTTPAPRPPTTPAPAPAPAPPPAPKV